MTIGENIKRIRNMKSLTQKDLAELLSVTPQNISQYERGVKTPKYETIKKIAAALQVNPSNIDERLAIVSDSNTEDSIVSVFNGHLDEKLQHIGYRIEANKEDSAFYVQYPDGILKVTIAQLHMLDESTDEFLKFQLSELRRKNAKDFYHNA